MTYLSNAVFRSLTTQHISDTLYPFNHNGGPDAWSFGTGPQQIQDKFGNIIARAEDNVPNAYFVWSTDGGITWQNQNGTGATGKIDAVSGDQPALAYDDIADELYICWQDNDISDGYYLRVYTITRNVDNTIANIGDLSGGSYVHKAYLNLQLEYQGGDIVAFPAEALQLFVPNLVFCNDIGAKGALVALWPVNNQASTGGNTAGCEFRASMRVLTKDANDNTATNWKNPLGGATSTSSIGPRPGTAGNLPYGKLLFQASAVGGPGSLAAVRKIAGANAKDIYIALADGNVTGSAEKYIYIRMKWNAGASDWSNGLTTPVTLANVYAGSGVTYAHNDQLVVTPSEDLRNDRVVLGFGRHASTTDRWSFCYIDSADAVSAIVDAYSSVNPDAESFITGDVAADSVFGLTLVTYTDFPNKDSWVAIYKGTTLIGSPIKITTGQPMDIPLICRDTATASCRMRSVGGGQPHLEVLNRDYNSPGATNVPPTYTPPYIIWQSTLLFARPQPLNDVVGAAGFQRMSGGFR